MTPYLDSLFMKDASVNAACAANRAERQKRERQHSLIWGVLTGASFGFALVAAALRGGVL